MKHLLSVVSLFTTLCLTSVFGAAQASAPTLDGLWQGTFETSAFTLAMDLSLAGAKATVKFSQGAREETPTPQGLKMQGRQIAFGVQLNGMELKFTGALAGDTLGGTVEGFRDNAKVGDGKWQLKRVAAFAAAPAPTIAPAAPNDADAVKQVIQRYLDVTEKKDAEAIKQAFHPDAKLLSVGRNGLNQMSLEEWWGRVSRIPGKVERKSQVTIVEVSGLAAVVKVDFGTSKDFISLLKLNGEWKIVNKILSTSLN